MSFYIGNKKVAGLVRGEDISHATETHAGIIEIATQNEVDVGTDDNKAITPLKAKNVYGGKIQIDYLGNKVFKVGDTEINYKTIHDLLLVSKDFTFIVYGNRAFLCSFINDESTTKELRFESVINSDGKTKTSSIYVTSNDGINITTVSVSDINSENQSNKVTTLTGYETNNNTYPTTKAVADVLKQKVDTSKYSPLLKTSTMTQEVGVDGNGKLWTAPSGGGGGVVPYATTETAGVVKLADDYALYYKLSDEPLEFDEKSIPTLQGVFGGLLEFGVYYLTEDNIYLYPYGLNINLDGLIALFNAGKCVLLVDGSVVGIPGLKLYPSSFNVDGNIYSMYWTATAAAYYDTYVTGVVCLTQFIVTDSGFDFYSEMMPNSIELASYKANVFTNSNKSSSTLYPSLKAVSDSFVSANFAQTLTDAQKAQARANLGIVSGEGVGF